MNSYKKFIHSLEYYWDEYWQEVSDPRSKNLFMMSGGPWKVIFIMFMYLVFCTKVGPEFMKNRKAFKLRYTMLIYNIFIVVINSYFFVMSVYYLDYGRDIFDFKFADRNDPRFYSDFNMRRMWLAYLYGWTKVLDLMDTIFFVLRKKHSQISGLHLYHHSIMPIFGWLVIKIAPTAICSGIFPLINTVVHIIMYSYYGLSAVGPSLQPYLWWKKYLTQLQLAQFVIFAVYVIVFVCKQEGYPMGVWAFIGVPQPFIFGLLFFNFYRKSYQKFSINFNNNNNKENNFFKNQMNDKMSGNYKKIINFIERETTREKQN